MERIYLKNNNINKSKSEKQNINKNIRKTRAEQCQKMERCFKTIRNDFVS